MDNLKEKNSVWKWGIFYFNPDDKRIFPPKKDPAFGWTVNFANWRSILAFVLMLAFFAFIFVMIESQSK